MQSIFSISFGLKSPSILISPFVDEILIILFHAPLLMCGHSKLKGSLKPVLLLYHTYPKKSIILGKIGVKRGEKSGNFLVFCGIIDR